MNKRYFLFLLSILIIIFTSVAITVIPKRQVAKTQTPLTLNTASPTIIPLPTSTSLAPPPFPPQLTWVPVPKSQIKTNKDVLYWSMDLRKCPPHSLCPEDKNLNKIGYSNLPGQEWVYYHQVSKDGQELELTLLKGYSFITDEAKKANWLNWEYKVKPGYSFFPVQGAQSLTYQPDCIYGVRNDQIKVACFTRIVSKNSTSGEGMMARYIYPYTEEFRFFTSDTVSLPLLLSQVKFQ
jgi:hypothetical protein